MWVETLLGKVVRPVANDAAIKWFWFSWYNVPEDAGDCDLDKIPESFVSADGIRRSVRFRYSVGEGDRDLFEARVRERIDAADAAISDFRDYDVLGDLGGDRFLGEPRTDERKAQRKETVVALVAAISRLTLDALVEVGDGTWAVEQNDNEQAGPFHSSFASPLHLFANITRGPVVVPVSHADSLFDASGKHVAFRVYL